MLHFHLAGFITHILLLLPGWEMNKAAHFEHPQQKGGYQEGHLSELLSVRLVFLRFQIHQVRGYETNFFLYSILPFFIVSRSTPCGLNITFIFNSFAAAKVRWHLSNTNVIWRIRQAIFETLAIHNRQIIELIFTNPILGQIAETSAISRKIIVHCKLSNH